MRYYTSRDIGKSGRGLGDRGECARCRNGDLNRKTKGVNLTTLPYSPSSAIRVIGFYLNDIMHFVAPFTARNEAGENQPDHALPD